MSTCPSAILSPCLPVTVMGCHKTVTATEVSLAAWWHLIESWALRSSPSIHYSHKIWKTAYALSRGCVKLNFSVFLAKICCHIPEVCRRSVGRKWFLGANMFRPGDPPSIFAFYWLATKPACYMQYIKIKYKSFRFTPKLKPRKLNRWSSYYM